MQSLTLAERARIDGLATFTAIAFVAGAGVIAALERVGAPDGFIEALGPLLAFAALSVIGLANRASSLTDFLAARRAIPALYAGLGFVGVLGGIGLVLAADAPAPDELPWLPIAAGAGVAGLVVAPTIRRANVSSAIDVLATRFPALPARVAFGAACFVCGALTAAAGFHLAAQSLTTALGGNAHAGVAFALAAMAFTLIPGGMKSATWADAASGGGTLLIIALGAGFAFLLLPAPWAPVAAELTAFSVKTQALRAGPVEAIAICAAVAFYFPLLSPGMTTPSSGEARKAAVTGLVLVLLGAAAAAIALPVFADAPQSARHTAQSLFAAATWLPCLTLGRAGVLAASRATGVDLARAYSRLTVLSSQRIAINRLAMVVAIALCPFALTWLKLSGVRALALALAGTLSFLAPWIILALALPKRASSVSALFAFLTAAGALISQYSVNPASFAGIGVVVDALAAGTAGLILGVLGALVLPGRGRRFLPEVDPFVDMPFDPVDAK